MKSPLVYSANVLQLAKLEQKKDSKEMVKKQSISSHAGPPSTATALKLRPSGTSEKKRKTGTM